jgi:two-component system, response regulator
MTERIDLLLVEDNPNDLELTLRALKRLRQDLKIQTLSDGAEALTYLLPAKSEHAKPHPRLIILDLKLPKISGKEVLHRLKSDARTRMIPIVVLTSSQQESDILECYLAGANSYMVKPVDFSRFAQSIEALGNYWLLINQAPL